MEDFEYSVEISDRDWECFFAECEECNLLPPSLAGVDDSGMSDMDDTASMLLKRTQKVDITADFSEAERPIDGPPDCEGSPVEDYLGKHGISGMESVLSGSEEDIHLQSINIFFERLKNLTEAAEPSQVRAGKNREAIQKEEQHSDGQPSSTNSLPKNIPKLNSLPASGETAIGKESMRPVDTMSNINIMKIVEPGSSVSPEPAASNSVIKTNKSTCSETELFIREEACAEIGVNEVTQQNDSPDDAICPETPPHTDEGIKVKMCSPLTDGHLLTRQLTLCDNCNAHLLSNLGMMTDTDCKVEQKPAVLHLDATSINKSVSLQSSPSASVKRKRRKKRRLSFEPTESSLGYERQVLVQPSDSEEEQYAGRAGTSLSLSEDVNLFHLKETQKNAASSLFSVTSSLPVRIPNKEIKANGLLHTVPQHDSQQQTRRPEDIVRQERRTISATNIDENNVTDDRSVTTWSQTDDGAMSAANNTGNGVTNVQPFNGLEMEDLTGLYGNSCVSGAVSAAVINKSDLTKETGNSHVKHGPVESRQQSDEVNQSVTRCEDEQDAKRCAEVKSIFHSILPSAESNGRAVDICQNDKLSTAKSVLAADAGNSGRDNHTPCQREAEPQQQLEIDCHDTDQYSFTLEKTHSLNTKCQQFKSRDCPLSEEMLCEITCGKSTSDCIRLSSDKRCLSESSSSIDVNDTVWKTREPLEDKNSSKSDKHTSESAHSVAPQVMTSPLPNGEINPTGISQKLTEDSAINSSDVTPLSSCTLETASVSSFPNGKTTDLSGNQNESRSQKEKTPPVLAKHEEEHAKSGPENQPVSNDSSDLKCDSLAGAGDVVTASQDECKPKKAHDSKRSLFAISSFWSEMEKLTIKDILHLRTSKAASPVSLPALQESEETSMLSTTDSSCFTQLDESKPKPTNEDMPIVPHSVEPGCIKPTDTSSRGVMWQSEPVPMSHGTDIYHESMTLTPQPAYSGSFQKGLRKIAKNISVQNLHDLETKSFSSTWKAEPLQIFDEGQSAKTEYIPDEFIPTQEKDMDTSEPSLLKDSYKISVMDIFQYFFGGKQSGATQAATENTPTFDTDGNSVPETYDHFFSEFDKENYFFNPLFTEDDQAKDELVPIFSCARSANRNLQYPEAYDYVFSSSSADDSSGESEEEADTAPVRVVSRFTRKASSSQISTDIYDNFFTDSDLKQNFFWKTTLSFRNVNFTGSTDQKQSCSSSLAHVPERQSDRALRRAVYPSNVLGNQDVMYPDPLLYHLEDRIFRQQAQQPFRYEDLQMIAVSNPSKYRFRQQHGIEDKKILGLYK